MLDSPTLLPTLTSSNTLSTASFPIGAPSNPPSTSDLPPSPSDHSLPLFDTFSTSHHTSSIPTSRAAPSPSRASSPLASSLSTTSTRLHTRKLTLSHPTQDVRYLKPIVSEIEAELAERAIWDTVKVDRSAKH